MRWPVATILTCIAASPLSAQEHAEGIAGAFEMFESRCILALTDPDGYFALLETEPPGNRLAASSADGAVRVALPRDFDTAENVSIVATPQAEQRACLTGYYADGMDEAPALVEAVLAFVDGREDLTLSAGGEVRLPDDPQGGVMSGMSFWRYIVTGVAVPDDVIVSINIGPDGLEVDGERVILQAGIGD